jgi:hypothetical protein
MPERLPRNIMRELETEYLYSRGKYGDDFDRLNTINDWVAYLVQYAGSASSFFSDPNINTREQARAKFREKMRKVANIAICAMVAAEEDWLPDRHYEGKLP